MRLKRALAGENCNFSVIVQYFIAKFFKPRSISQLTSYLVGLAYRFEVIADYCINFGHCTFEPPLTLRGIKGNVYSVASLGWVTPGAAIEGVTPLFFPEKPGDLFLVTPLLQELHWLRIEQRIPSSQYSSSAA